MKRNVCEDCGARMKATIDLRASRKITTYICGKCSRVVVEYSGKLTKGKL